MPPTSSTVIAWELGIRMREAREQVGLSGVKAAKQLGVSQNYLSDVEHGKRRLTQETLTSAIPAYGIPEPEQEELWTLRDQVDQRGWWSKYTGIFAPEVLRYFGLEHGAESIQTYENLLIPGLLQTEAYAHAVVTGDPHNIRTSESHQRVKTRLLRQRRLTDGDPIRVTAVVSEAAIKQHVGGPEVRAEQLQHLINLVEQHAETVDLRILPFSAGACGVLGASTFHVLDFPNPGVPAVVWQEAVMSFGVISHPQRVNEFGMSFDRAMEQAADQERSLDLIRDEIKAIT